MPAWDPDPARRVATVSEALAIVAILSSVRIFPLQRAANHAMAMPEVSPSSRVSGS